MTKTKQYSNLDRQKFSPKRLRDTSLRASLSDLANCEYLKTLNLIIANKKKNDD